MSCGEVSMPRVLVIEDEAKVLRALERGLRVLLRGRGERETFLRAADLHVDLLERRARRGEAEVPLTHREFDVLTLLLRHKNHAVTREMLGREVWREPGYALTNVIDVTM